MRRTLLLLPVFCFLTTGSFAQRTLKDIDDNKYRINLPDYWGKNSKVVRILMDKLPSLAEEIKDKEICGDDCNPAYNIDFYLSYPEIVDQGMVSKPNTQPASARQQINTLPLIRTNLDNRTNPDPQILASNLPTIQATPNANWEVETYYRFECFLVLKDRHENVITRFLLVDPNDVWTSVYKINNRDRLSSEVSQNPLTFLDKNREKFLPNIYEQLNIVDTQILNLQ